MSVDPFIEFMTNAGDPAWRDAQFENPFLDTPSAGAEIYLACFNTPAGRAVLADLYRTFVNVSRVVPGEPEGSGFYREGGAQVVHHIAAMVETGAQGEEPTDGEN